MKAKSSTLKINGSIELICGHSNPDTLRGRNAIMILFDEIAFFDEKGKVSGTKFYDDLKPSVARFYKHKAAKIVMISSPNAKSGIFHDIFQDSKEDKKTLSFQLPTWLVNLDLSYENADIQIDKKRNPDNFAKEYGAQFSASSNYGNFFEEILIDKCVSYTASPHANPDRKMNYYLHVDPANGTNNYAAVLVGKERYTNRIGHKRTKCHLAGIWIWKPGEYGLLFHNIDKDVLAICQKFRPVAVTYDSYQSVQSLQFLRNHNVPATELRFGRDNKMKLYQNLLDLMAYEYGPELVLYDDGSANAHLLIQELKNLRKKKTQRGWTITPDKDAEIKTDDLCVHPDTFVFTDTPKRIKEVEIGEYIFTHNGIYSKILAKKEHTDFKKIVELCPRLCLPLVATDNHPVEVYNIHSKQRTWKPIMDLDIDNDMIVRSIDKSEKPFTIDLVKYASLIVPKHCGINDYISDKKIKDRNANAQWHNRFLESNYDSGYLFGVYLAEGSIHDHGISFAANFNEKKIHENLSKYTNSVFGLNDTGHKKQKYSNGSQSNINSQIVKRLFMDLFGGKTAGEKFIPKIMTNANFDFQKGLLNGLWDGDGCYSKSKNAFVYTTTSESMAIQISAMLLRFGIISSINRIKRKGRVTTIREQSFKLNYDLFNIFVFNSESFNNLAKLLNGYTVLSKKKSKFHKPMAVIEDGFAAYKIREIRDGCSQTVVNLTVENCHSYVSGFVNSHNCDCLAGACSSANNVLKPSLPELALVRMRY